MSLVAAALYLKAIIQRKPLRNQNLVGLIEDLGLVMLEGAHIWD